VLDAPSVTIGRSRDRTIVLCDASVSGEHCTIFRKGDDYFICDTGSLNGTTVNGLKLDFRKEVKLPDEATIKTGNARSRVWRGQVRRVQQDGVVDAGDLKFRPASLIERLDYGREFNKAKTMEQIEREAIEDALKRHNGHKKTDAEELGIGFSTLKRKCKEARIGCGNGD
jgi:hypothetical protein